MEGMVAENGFKQTETGLIHEIPSEFLQETHSFKQTKISLIPEDWEVVKLDGYIEKSKEKNKTGGRLPVYTVSNIFGFVLSDQFFDKKVYSDKLTTYKVVRNNYFAYNPYRINVGSLALFRQENDCGLVSSAYVVFKIKDEKHNSLDEQFLFLILKSPQYIQKIKNVSMSRGSVRRTLSYKDLTEFFISLPPLPEQRKIARVLSTIQRAIEQQDKIIETIKKLKRSLMQKLFTEGLYGEEQKETEIGPMPQSWEVVRLGDDILTATQYGLSLRGSKEEKYPILRMNNLTNGYINPSNLQFVNVGETTFGKFKLERGDILFNRTNSIELVGKTSIFNLDGEFVFASYLIRLKTNPDSLNPYFLNFYFNWDITQSRLKGLASRGVSQANISATRLKTLKIPLPPLPEQKQIAHILSTVDKKIKAEQRRKAALKRLFKTMLHKLMTGEIRVKDMDM
jgi:type I restriction enzyme S subunit